MVEEGGSPFERVRHRHPIDLHEEVLGEVRHRVGVLHPGQVVARGGLVLIDKVALRCSPARVKQRNGVHLLLGLRIEHSSQARKALTC